MTLNKSRNTIVKTVSILCLVTMLMTSVQPLQGYALSPKLSPSQVQQASTEGQEGRNMLSPAIMAMQEESTPTRIPPRPELNPSVLLEISPSLAKTFDFSGAGDGDQFRVLVSLRHPSDMKRLQEWGVQVLKEYEGYAYVLVDKAQLEKLSRLGFRPIEINSVEYLAQVYNTVKKNNQVTSQTLADSPDLLLSLSSVDTDDDGLTDTEESWWCTDPQDNNSDSPLPPNDPDEPGYDPNLPNNLADGKEVQDILRGIRAYGPPFALWPQFTPHNPSGTCPDGDFDAVPDYAEEFVIGTSNLRESSDLDKFDDGQELFGVTYCPGANGPCGYGILPRAEDAAFVSAILPAWVKEPGDSPFVAAFPEPRVEVVPSSLKLTQVTIITNTNGTTVGTEKTYGSSTTKGTSTSVADTITWNNWTSVTNYKYADVGTQSNSEVFFAQENNTEKSRWAGVLNAQKKAALATGNLLCESLNLVFNSCNIVKTGYEAAKANIQLTGETYKAIFFYKDNPPNEDQVQDQVPMRCMPDTSPRCSASKIKVASGQDSLNLSSSADQNNLVSTGINFGLNLNSQLLVQPIYQMSYPVKYLDSSNSSGQERGGSQTTTSTKYEEQTISQSSTNQYSNNWSTATAVDSSHAADLHFTYNIVNNGTEYAREVTNLTFNVYIGNDPNPAYTYVAIGSTGQIAKIENFFPNDSLTYTSNSIALSLDEMRAIDEGAPIRIVMEDISFGQDQVFYLDALNGSVTVAMEDGYDDLDETVDTYLVPVWDPSDTVQDVAKRYFPVVEDTDGNLLAVFTPESALNVPESCVQDTAIAPASNTLVYCKHALNGSSWWNFYISDGLDYNGEFQSTLAAPNTTMLIRIVTDSDLDGYNNRNELKLGTDKENSAEHPSPNLIAAYTKSCMGNNCTLHMAFQNLGNYDAYGVEAVLYSPDGLVTITNNTIGGSGRVPAGSKVVVGPSDTFQYTTTAGAVEPVIMVSYNDPQGNHRFILPSGNYPNGTLLTDLESDISGLDGKMLADPGVDIASTGKGQASFVINSPHPTAITNGKLFVEYIDSQGNVANEDTYTQNFASGPTVIPVTVDLNTYPEDEYILLAFFTDSQGNIIDSSARPLASFGADPSPEVNVTVSNWRVGISAATIDIPDPWDFGIAQPSTTLHGILNIANTGLGDLRYSLIGFDQNITLGMGSSAGTLSPSESNTVSIAIDTAGMLAGPFDKTLTLRTNDPSHGMLTIHITGTIGNAGQVVAYKANDFRPWDQYVYVSGPHNQNDVVSFAHTLTEDPTRMFPLYLYTEDGQIKKGYGEYSVDPENRAVPFGIFGTGIDGGLTVANAQTVYTDNTRSPVTVSATSGQSNLTLSSSAGFIAGQEVLVIQMQGTGTGNFEFRAIASIVGNVIQLSSNLTNAYNVGVNSKVQVIRVMNYQTVTVQSGGILTIHAWDGNTGGVMAFKAKSSLIVQAGGKIDASGKGYRGVSHGAIYRNQTGYQGEGYLALGVQTYTPNGNGGGGGQGTLDAGGGGGGGNGDYGSGGGWSYNGHHGGAGGSPIGSPEQQQLFLGGAGGEGGADEDGGNPGGGGAGGGAMAIFASTIQNNGIIQSNGNAGANACQTCGGGTGTGGMGGGGGGAGGSILIIGEQVALGENMVVATGGSGGSVSSGTGIGGAGSLGRIRVEYGTLAGNTNPAASTAQRINLIGTTPTTLYLPEIIASNYRWYILQYGQRSSTTGGGDQLFSVRLPNRQYNDTTISVLTERVTNSGSAFNFCLDIGNDGACDYTINDQNFSAPVRLDSTNLANALNAYITAQHSPQEYMTIPIRINISTPADIFLFNLSTSLDADADLVPANLTVTPPNGNPASNIPEGSQVTLSAEVTNNGTYKAENFTVGFYNGDPATDGTLIGSTFIPSLDGGATSALQSVTWNTTGLLGTQTIYVKVDVSSRVAESNETNNTTSAPAVIKKKADLVITALALPSTRENENGIANVTLRNDGEADVTAAVVKLYLGEDATGAFLGSASLDVPQGQSVQGQVSYSINTAGPHSIFALVDPDNQVLEAIETNNTRTTTTLTGWDALTVDAGGANDVLYDAESDLGYGRLIEGTANTSCGATPEQSYRQAGSAESLEYQFDNLLPGRFYHLDLTFTTCSGDRYLKLRVEDQPITELGDDPLHPIVDREIHVTSQTQTVSILLDPADYADGSVKLSILRSSGLSGPMVNLIQLSEVRYCHLDSGPSEQAWSAGNQCGYDPSLPSDGFNGWGTAPYQTVRFSEDGQFDYKFSGLHPAKEYNVRLTYFEGDGLGRQEQIKFDGTPAQTITLSSTPRSILLAIPPASYADGTVLLNIEEIAGKGAVISEVTLEQDTGGDDISVPPTPTPTFTPTATPTLTPTPTVPSVILSAFTANWTGNQVTVGWSTTTEINNAAFKLFRSADTLAWTEIAALNSSRPCGTYTGTSPVSYSYTDTAVSAGQTYYYRLQFSGSGCGGGSSMSIQTASAVPWPGPFGKSSPAHQAVDQPKDVTIRWETSANATSYEYCFDAVDDNTCTLWVDNGSSTSANPTGLEGGKTYYWHVRAVNAQGETYSNGLETAYWSFTTIEDPPLAFSKLSPMFGAQNQPRSLNLTWSSSAGAADYLYCYDKTNDNDCASWTSSEGNTTVGISGLDPDTAYYWQVQATNDGGSTPANGGTWWTFTTVPNKPAAFGKTAPVNGAASQSLSPTLSWQASAGATDYEYCLDTSNDSTCDGDWTSSIGAVTVNLSGLSVSTTYYWQVRAVNPGGNTEADNETWWAFTTLTNPPGGFGKSSPANGATDQPTSLSITWTASVGADRYEYCLAAADVDACTTWMDNGSATTKLLNGLSPATTYYWHVRAVNLGGATYSDTGEAAHWSFTTVPNAPAAFTKLSPPDGAQAQPTSLALTWAPSDGATSYEYCYDTSDDDACAPWVDNGSATSVDLSNLTSGDTYYWQVRAVNPGGSAYADAGSWWSYTILSDTPIFADVPVGYWARLHIERLYLNQITGGCGSNPLRYCPTTNVNRAMMAVFVLRAAHGLDFTPPPATGTVFTDVPADSFAAAWIEQLATDGITGGCGGGKYCPNSPVTRAMMAVFLVKAMYGVDYTPPEATGAVFLDIPQNGFAAAFIEKLAADGVTGGCGGGNFCPNKYINRAEMAVFMVAAFDLP